MAQATRRVWMIACPGAELLDVTGPWEVLGQANDVLGRPAYALHLVAPLGGAIGTRHGLTLGDPLSLRRAVAAGRPHTLIVAGNDPRPPLSPAATHLVRWLRRHHREVARIVSICTGAFVLAEAGLLDGRRATTHWRFLPALRRRFPRARVADESLYIRDGKVWTSAGITAGIDLTLALVEADHGRPTAMAVARDMLLYLRRSGRQAQFSAALRGQEQEPAGLDDLTGFVLEHLAEDLPVERLARALGTSPRTLTRRCRERLAESPAALVRRLRLEEARRLLEEGALPLKTIAARAGLGDASTLWRACTRELGVAPAQYRGRFAEPSPTRTDE
jgi:transcriptional regulator GlxA family with amidase domain